MTPFLSLWGDMEEWGIWDEGRLARLLLALGVLIVLAFVFSIFVSKVLSRVLARAVGLRIEERDAIERRVHTLSNTLNWGFRMLLVFVGMGLVLGEFGLNVSALIASVGIVGVAVGLGAQTLVRDVLNGMFILIEDQYAVGDTVTVAGITGDVVEINPRRTVLRDPEGNIHSIPNSAITIATNRTAGLNRFVVEIQVPFRESEKAAELAGKVCADLAKERAEQIANPPKVIAERALPDGMVGLTLAGDARPALRWALEAELRRRLKRSFDSAPLEMEFASEASK